MRATIVSLASFVRLGKGTQMPRGVPNNKPADTPSGVLPFHLTQQNTASAVDDDDDESTVAPDDVQTDSGSIDSEPNSNADPVDGVTRANPNGTDDTADDDTGDDSEGDDEPPVENLATDPAMNNALRSVNPPVSGPVIVKTRVVTDRKTQLNTRVFEGGDAVTVKTQAPFVVVED
jgi:hypothetical protein